MDKKGQKNDTDHFSRACSGITPWKSKVDKMSRICSIQKKILMPRVKLGKHQKYSK